MKNNLATLQRRPGGKGLLQKRKAEVLACALALLFLLLGLSGFGQGKSSGNREAAFVSLQASQANPNGLAEFSDCIFVGDEFTRRLALSKALPDSAVIAETGATAGSVLKQLGNFVKRSPLRIYFLLGQCDLLIPVDDPLTFFVQEYRRLIQSVQESLPECDIYLQSIPPVTKSALQSEPRYGQIETYNKAIKNLAEELSVTYIDLSPLIAENTAMYTNGGIQFEYGFFPLWLRFLKESVDPLPVSGIVYTNKL